jgi:hypothetical protein
MIGTERKTMKFTSLIAAGLALATLSLGAAAPAEAQRHDRGYSQDHRGNGPRAHHNNRRDDRRFRGNRGRHYSGYNQRCRTEWRNHRRIQICR